MIAAAQAATAPLRVLLVGDQEEDFFLIREILERNRTNLPAELEHARTISEARAMLKRKPYGLVLFQPCTGNTEAVRLLSEFHHDGISLPFILLTENADEKTVAELIEADTWNRVTKSQLDGATLVRTIQGAPTLHWMQREQHSAEESLRKLSRAVEQSDDSIVVTNRQGVIEYVNPAFEQLTGFRREEVIGKTPRILKSGEQSPETCEEMWKVILSGKVYRGILVNRKKNGELYYVEESISPVRDGDGEITHFIANGRDLTERRRLEAQLVQAQEMDAIGRLAGGVAHDFNNLLTIITSYSELARDSVAEDSSLQTKLNEILSAARRATELTRQVLAFSRKQPQALRVMELNPVIENLSKTLPRLIGEDIEFSFAPGEGLAPVRIDPVQIEQILMNLAINARDAMPRGGHLQVETTNTFLDASCVQHKPAVIAPGQYALITVTDDGAGIPRSDLPHIFEPFCTTKPMGKARDWDWPPCTEL